MRPGLFQKLLGWFRSKLPWVVRTQSEEETLVHILHSELAWRKARNLYISTHRTCEMCGIDKKLEVHHVIPYSKCEALRYDQSNLVTLCRECHFRFGHGRSWFKSNPGILDLCKFSRENLSQVR